MSAPTEGEEERERTTPEYEQENKATDDPEDEEEKGKGRRVDIALAAEVITKGVELEKWGKRKHIARGTEIAVNAGEKMNQAKEVFGYVQQGAEGVKKAAVMNEEATKLGAGLEDMDMEEVVEAAEEAGVAHGVDGAQGGLEQMVEEAAADEIVEGHHYFECIEGNCLETPVRFVAEEIALPIYKCMGETCFSCCCTGDSAQNLDNANQTGEVAGEAAKGASDAAGSVAKYFNSGICGFLDSANWCVFDEVLAHALPVIGTLFSCLRLYQGTLLSFKGCLGRCRVRHGEKKEKVRFQWMAAEGHARLWQGSCGLIGAAPGLIIVTLPTIIACGVMAHKAKKKRKLIENDGVVEKKDVIDGQVIQSQPLPEAFPTPEARKEYFYRAYQIVSGEKSIDGEKGVDQELLELGFSDKSNPYPNAPVGQWSTGLCDCFEHFPSCFTACCFPCFTVGQVSKSARLFKGVFYATVVAYVIDYALGFGAILIILFGTYAVAKSRARVGKVYGIAVNPFANWCLSFWCGYCVVAQLARHLYGWDSKNSGRCSGWLECGPNPTSKWPSVGRSHSSHSQSGGVHGSSRSSDAREEGPEHSLLQEKRIVHAPSAVAPMERC